MDPLFLRVFPRLLAGLAIACLIFFLVIDPRVHEIVARNVEKSVGAGLSVIAQVIARELEQGVAAEASPTLAAVARSYDCPADIVARSEVALSGEQNVRLDRGETIAVGPRFGWTFISRIGQTDRVLRLTRPIIEHPFGGERGIGVGLVLVIGLFFGAYFLVSPIKRRLNALSRTAEELGRGVLTVRATDRSRDAIGSLAMSFNRMAEEIHRLIGAQQELLRTVSHEVRTPIQRVHIALELARDARDDAKREEAFNRAENALEDLDRLIDELLTYARLEDHATITRKEIDIGGLVANIVSSLAELQPAKALTFDRPPGTDWKAVAETRLVERAVSNLIRNALQHSRSKVRVTIGRAGDALVIDVDDDGLGVAPEDRLRIFEPFKRVVRAGEEQPGFGLGLAIVRRVAEAHGGKIEVFDSTLGGARFRLSLHPPVRGHLSHNENPSFPDIPA